jgi:hypothetical protein
MAERKTYTFTDPETGKELPFQADSMEAAKAAYMLYKKKTPRTPVPQAPPPTPQEADPGDMLGVDMPSVPQDPRSTGQQLQDLGQAGAEYGGIVLDEADKMKYTLGGTVLGIPAGPPGMIVGGAIGSTLDELSRQGVQGEDLDVAKALMQGAFSVGIDIGTLGFGRFVGKPIWNKIKARLASGEDASKLVKELAETDAKGVVSKEVADVNTQQARMQTQQVLEKSGETLSRHQLGLGTSLSDLLESVGRLGVGSRGVFTSAYDRIALIAKDRFDKIISDTNLSAEDIGFGLDKGFKAAKEAAGLVMERQKKVMAEELGNNAVTYKHIRDAVEKWPKRKMNKNELGGSELSSMEMDVVAELSEYITAKSGTPQFLFNFDDKVKSVLKKALKEAPDDQAYRRLTIMQKSLKTALIKNLGEVSPKAVNMYKKMNRDYRRSRTLLYPRINESFVKNTDTQGLAKLGNMFSQNGNSENIQAAMKSLKETYRLLSPNQQKNLPFKSLGEAQAAVAHSYAAGRLGSLTVDVLDPLKFSKEAIKLTEPTYVKAAKAAMGKHFNDYKRTVNMMAHAVDDPRAGAFSLVLRGKEMSSVSKFAASLGSGNVQGAGRGLTGALSVIMLPQIMARLTLNPKHVNKLAYLMHLKAGQENKVIKGASLLVNDVVEDMFKAGMSDEEVETELRGGL